MSFDPEWSCANLAEALCDALVKRGHLKEKPAFIRQDREAKLASVFQSVGLDGAKMASVDNPGAIEMLVRKGTNGEPWVNQVMDALTRMLPEDVQHAAKRMGMDEETKAQLEAAKEKTAHRRERLEEQKAEEEKERGGSRANGGGGRGGDERESGGRRGDRENWDGEERPLGARREREGVTANMECYNCGQTGHTSRDCPEPRKVKGGGKGKNRKEMICANCKKLGHKSRDCPEPVDEAAVIARLAARAAKAEPMKHEDPG